MKIWISSFFLIYVSCVAWAMQNYDAEQLGGFYKNLRCLECTGQTVYDSDAIFAKDIKLKTVELLEQGKNLTEIEEFFVQIYGPEIIVNRQFSDFSLALWLIPLLLIAIFVYYVTCYKKRTK